MAWWYVVERHQSFSPGGLGQLLERGERPIPGSEPSSAGELQKGSCRVGGRGGWLEGPWIPSHSMRKVGSPVSHRWLPCAD